MSDMIAAEQLKSFVGRIERLSEELDGLKADIADIYAEAKSNGFDVKVLRKIIAMRKKDAAELSEEEAILQLYMDALGMLPLFREAAE